ncbi:phage minor head protein [Palleronia caenipelagi]|nr:phage minor head protein [Palleronia caenipelagi]
MEGPDVGPGVGLKPLLPEEALAYFRSKGLAPPDDRFDYRDVWQQEHARSFVVAKAMQDDVLTTIRDSLTAAMVDGTLLEDWKASLKPTLQEAGWWGDSLIEDPRTGEIETVRLGSDRRLRVISDTNMRSALAAGRWARIDRTKRAFPYLGYRQIDRPTKREEHKRFDGLVRPVDDPVWAQIYPPNGWFCKCAVFQITQGQIDRGEFTVSPPFDLDEVAVPNPRRGPEDVVPDGVDPAFDGNPGRDWLDMERRMDRIAGDDRPAGHQARIGLAAQLRQNILFEGFERGAFLTPEGRIFAPVQATKARPSRLRGLPPELELPPGSSFIHSHPSERPLSPQDLASAIDYQLADVTAVTPAGNVYQARPRLRDRVLLDRSLTDFLTEISAGWSVPYLDGLGDLEREVLIQHARLRWLDRQGIIAYSYDVSGWVHRLFADRAALLEVLDDVHR